MFIILLFLIMHNVILGQLAFTSKNFNSTQSPSEIVVLDDIEYSFYDYRVTWEEARIICLGYQSHLTTLDTEKKAIFIAKQTSESSLVYEEFWIGSKMNSFNHWLWTMNNKHLGHNKFLYKMDVIPRYHNRSYESTNYCLTIFRKNHNTPIFIPLRCHEERRFICQKDTSTWTNIVHVFSMKVDGKEFILYSANVTWPEAVMQCRQRGLQIAEVLTLMQAQSLAMKMLRVRPRSIENAWIGGHLINRKWKWILTGQNISHNELWTGDHMDTGDCLLLDRHACQLPAYVSGRCDRKRNFLCQKFENVVLDTKPVAVSIDTCQYWIGFHSLSWMEARQSCKSLNSTLVSLSSPVTLNHVKHIMIDNRKQVQHIWINGVRHYGTIEEGKKQTNGGKVWKWDDSGREIAGPEDSFIPWCKDSRLDDVDADCLNMDTENFDTPMVYGLNCNITQNYICQKKSKECDEIAIYYIDKKDVSNYTSAQYETTIESPANTSITEKKPASPANTSVTENKPESPANTSVTENKPKSPANTSVTENKPQSPMNTSVTENKPGQNKSLIKLTNKTNSSETTPSTFSSRSMENDDNLSVRILDDGFQNKTNNKTSDLKNAKNVVRNNSKNESRPNSKNPSKPESTLNFMDIIEYMINDVNRTNEKNNASLSKNSQNNSSHNKQQINFVKDHISQLVQLKMNKMKSTTTSSTSRTTITTTTSTTTAATSTAISSRRKNTQPAVVTQTRKTFKAQTTEQRPKYNVNQAMNRIYQEDNVYPKVVIDRVDKSKGLSNLNFDYNKELQNLNRQPGKNIANQIKSPVVPTRYNLNLKTNNLKNKNYEKSNNSTPAFSKEFVQSMPKTKTNNSSNIDDVVSALKKRIDMQNLAKEISFVATDDLQKNNKVGYVKPLNLILQRVLESLNDTRVQVKNRTMLFKVKPGTT